MTRPPRESFKIVVHAEGDGPPVSVRLKRFLKSALRGWGLRCSSIEAVQTPEPAEADPAPEGGR